MPRTPTRRPSPAPTRGRKNMRLDQSLLDQAKRALGTESETEAVTLALRRVVDKERALDGLQLLGGRLALDESRIND